MHSHTADPIPGQTFDDYDPLACLFWAVGLSLDTRHYVAERTAGPGKKQR
jgi:hypothetical protein